MQVNDKKIKHALIKVGLTPNRIFGLCDIWVIILRRNVMYLKFIVKIHLMTLYPETDSEKVDENIIEITFLRTNDTDIAHTKYHICLKIIFLISHLPNIHIL